MAVGHEYAGEIVELGSEVRGFNTGDRVSGKGTLPAGIAAIAAPGDATYAAIPRAWASTAPEPLPNT